jgi:hypothetical protein
MSQTIINVPAAGAFDPTDIEITDGVDDAFLIKDTGGNEWFKIDTRTGTGSDCINMAYTSGQRVLIGKPASAGQGPYSPFQVINGNLDSQAVRIYGSANYDTTNQLTWGGPSNQPAMIHPYGLLFRSSASTGTFQFQDSSNADMFALDDDSNATFTLDSSSTCNFKVVDNAGSPITYIDVERGSTARVKIPVVGLETIRATGGAFVAGVSNTTGINLNTFPLNYANTLLTFDQTADGTTSNQSTKPGLTVVYSSSATGAATSSGITLQLGAGVPADGITSPQYLVMHNQNATHSVKFILDGSGFYNGHEVATSGSDAADLIGAGFTLAAGKFAVFSILACRVTNTGDHYFYAVSLHTKT